MEDDDVARKQHSGISDQRKASIHRLEDAEALFEAKRYRGCMYMAGYAVECRLKYKLMRRWNCFTLEQLEDKLNGKGIVQSPFTHSLMTLLRLAGGLDRLGNNTVLWGKFSGYVNRWEPAWRYAPDLGNRSHAEDILDYVKEVLRWIENNL
jgi:HEPN domain-containing protein